MTDAEYRALVDKLSQLQQDVAVIKVQLLGNGTPGLPQRVMHLEEQVTSWSIIVRVAAYILPVFVALTSIIVSLVVKVL